MGRALIGALFVHAVSWPWPALAPPRWPDIRPALTLLADAGAVELTGDAAALAEALARIWRLQGDDWERLATRGAGWMRWLRSHPTVGERIAALRAMAAPARQAPRGHDRIAVVPVETWGLGGHHPAQRLARRWLL